MPTNLDRDGDGVLDATDNCVEIFNPQQYNEDGDPLGDVCDNCPHIANADQANVGETSQGRSPDLVGDACDPNPDQSGDLQHFFLGFNSADDLTGWSFAGDQDFKLANGQLQNRVTTNLALAWRNNLQLTADSTLVAKVTYRGFSQNYASRGAAVLGRFARNGNLGIGVGCGQMRTSPSTNNPFLNGSRYTGNAFDHSEAGTTTVNVNTMSVYTTRLTNNGATCGMTGVAASWSVASTSNGSGAAISVWGASVDIDYLIAYKR